MNDVNQFDLTNPLHVKFLFGSWSDEECVKFAEEQKANSAPRGTITVASVDTEKNIIYFGTDGPKEGIPDAE